MSKNDKWEENLMTQPINSNTQKQQTNVQTSFLIKKIRNEEIKIFKWRVTDKTQAQLLDAIATYFETFFR